MRWKIWSPLHLDQQLCGRLELSFFHWDDFIHFNEHDSLLGLDGSVMGRRELQRFYWIDGCGVDCLFLCLYFRLFGLQSDPAACLPRYRWDNHLWPHHAEQIEKTALRNGKEKKWNERNNRRRKQQNWAKGIGLKKIAIESKRQIEKPLIYLHLWRKWSRQPAQQWTK